MKNNISYSRSEIILLFFAWWIFWALTQSVVLHRLGIEWPISFIDAFISNLLLTLSCVLTILLYRYYQPGASSRIYRLIFAVAITLLFCSALKWILGFIFTTETNYLKFLDTSMPIRFIVSLLMLSFVTILNWMWSVLQEQKEQEKRSNEVEKLVKEAELVKLRQQLQPHFLFNSLNSISALAGSKPTEARKMIQQLSDFLRGTLKKDEQQTVPLEEELEQLKLYLEIEKVRFGNRLNLEIKNEEACNTLLLPPLLLQPIVENAIKFGLYGTTDEITVIITAHFDSSFLFIEVKNPFDTETQNMNAGTGFGLNSIQRRLFLLYARNDLITTNKIENTFITKLKIPQSL